MVMELAFNRDNQALGHPISGWLRREIAFRCPDDHSADLESLVAAVQMFVESSRVAWNLQT